MNSGSTAESETHGRTASDCSMSKSELETLAVSAILEHRRLLTADQEVYEEWIRASDDPTTPAIVLQSLQDEHTRRQKKSEAQQQELARIIDALGFVPEIPDDQSEGSN